MKIYPAPISRRFWALAIDLFVVSTISTSVGVVFGFIYDANLPKWLYFGLLFIFFGAVSFYFPIAEAFFDGKTVGKAALGIRVVSSDGSPASGIKCLQRYLIQPFDIIFTLGIGGLICTLITQKRQRFGDLVADTAVVTDNSHTALAADIVDIRANSTSPQEVELTKRINPYLYIDKRIPPLQLATLHRSAECDIAMLRTHKSDPRLIEFMERLLSSIHIGMFRHGTHTWVDMLTFTLRSIPRAVYEARWAIFTSLAVVIVSYIIGIYSQIADPDFFEQVMGRRYTEVTLENIAEGNPMGIYGSMEPFEMFCEIFFNNLFVALHIYVLGIFTFIGPVLILLKNFVSFAAFETFFAQQGLTVIGLVTPHEHGVLELSSIIMAGGASILLGTGWLFPGRLTRLQALARSARHSLLIMVSTIPMLLVAAIIESFITRHTEWPMSVKLSIIIVSTIIIIGYYVMLPIVAKRH